MAITFTQFMLFIHIYVCYRTKNILVNFGLKEKMNDIVIALK